MPVPVFHSSLLYVCRHCCCCTDGRGRKALFMIKYECVYTSSTSKRQEEGSCLCPVSPLYTSNLPPLSRGAALCLALPFLLRPRGDQRGLGRACSALVSLAGREQPPMSYLLFILDLLPCLQSAGNLAKPAVRGAFVCKYGRKCKEPLLYSYQEQTVLTFPSRYENS